MTVEPDDPQAALAVLRGQSLRTVVARYLVLAMGSIATVVVARALKASGRGAYAFVTALATMAFNITHLSVEQAFIFFWPKRERQRALVGSGLAVAAISGSVVGLVVGPLAAWLFADFFPDGATAWMVVLTLSALPLWVAALYLNAALALGGRVDVVNSTAVITTAVHTGVLAAVAWAGELSLGVVVVIWTAAIAFPVFILLPRVMSSPGVAHPSPKLMKDLVGVGIRYHFGHIALSLVLRVDILLLVIWVTIAQVGVYSLAVTLAELAYVAAASIAQVALHVQVRGDPSAKVEFTALVARVNVWIAVVIVAGIAVAAPIFVPTVFGQSFRGTAAPIVALGPGVIALAFLRPIQAFLIHLNRPWYVTAAMTGALATNVILNFALVPWIGIVGAGVASSVSYLGLAIWGSAWFVRSTGRSPRLLIPRLADLRSAVARRKSGSTRDET